jgi:tetratricopeptide (TPR) repeat protein
MKTRFVIMVFVIGLLTASVHAVEVSPIVEAVSNGNKAEVEVLLARGADVNVKDHRGRTPLFFAAANKAGTKDMVELLLARGADINAKDVDGETPLHYAPFSRQKDIVELLLIKGADVNAKSNSGHTPLDNSQMLNNANPDVWDLLEDYVVKKAKKTQEVFGQFSQQLKNKPSDSTRRLLIKFASEMRPTPAIPEEARKHFVEGTAVVKAAKNPSQLAIAAQSFKAAIRIAPWWGDAYYNYGVTTELAEEYDEAEEAFKFYLASNPGETERRDVQDRLYALSAKRKLLGVK